MPLGSPLIRIEYETKVTHSIISLIHCSVKPNVVDIRYCERPKFLG